MVANWCEVYPANEQNPAKVKFGDYPSGKEIIEKLQDVGMISMFEDISNYEVDADCSFIAVYGAKSGELLYRFEIE